MRPLSVAFIWHMHQPYYRDFATGECTMPWVRLHATKDYVDMVKRLEAFPSIHQTFNLVPSLLDQLEEWLPPANRTDTFWELSERPAAGLSEAQQQFLTEWFFLAHPEQMIKAHPRYGELFAKRGKPFNIQDYLDLQVWFNLTWIDPWLRRQDAQLAALEARGSSFTEEEKRYVLACHRRLLADVLPAYREAAARGQIELSTSPYYHPIMPLLCDTKAAQAALPQVTLPKRGFQHPEDARWQLHTALARHQQVFGHPAQGIWPSEGSVSDALADLAIEAKLRWLATDEQILWRTLGQPRQPALLYRPHRVRRAGGETAVVFRDRELSDLLGFTYSQWEPALAVNDFIGRLEAIRQATTAQDSPALASIILDGENAWEAYPDDAHEFLTGLYQALAHDERFRCVTVSEFLEIYPLNRTEPLTGLFSGSWIDGNFATWIGHPQKNAAWEHLAEARAALEGVSREDPKGRRAWQSLGAAEGSDWMWWFGDTHFTAQADEFDRLFRAHLVNAYQFAGHPVPPALRRPIRRREEDLWPS